MCILLHLGMNFDICLLNGIVLYDLKINSALHYYYYKTHILR